MIMEFSQAKYGKECEEQEHGVEENEARNAQPADIYTDASHQSTERHDKFMQHTKKDHKSNKMARPLTHAKLHRSIPAQWHHPHAKRCQHHPHRNIRHMRRILRTALKVKATIIPRERASEPNEHLAEWRMHVKVKLALEVMRAELAKVGFVPDDDV